MLIISAALPVAVDAQEPPERVFSLAFSGLFEENQSRSPGTSIPDDTDMQSVRDVIAVSIDSIIRSLSVSVSITHSYRGDLRVTLISPSGREVVLHVRRGSDRGKNLRTTWNDGDLPALADLLGTNPLGDWTLTVGDHGSGDTGTLDEWSLSMTIYVPSGTAQTAQTVQPVQAGRTEPVRLSLLGEAPLGAGETLTVDFAYVSQGGGVGGGVSIFSPDPVRFTAGNTTLVELTLSAATNALEGTLTATVSDTLPSTLLGELRIAPADLLVEILPREYTLSFMTSDGAPLARVLTDGTEPVRLSLLGEAPLGTGETLTVDFEYDVLGVSVSSPAQVRFTAGSTVADLTLSAATNALSGILTATVSSTLLNMLPIAPADLPVEILPREFALMFTTLDDAPLETARVPAGTTTRVRLSLSGDGSLGMDETLTVTFSYDPVDGGVSVSSPTQASFVEGSTTIDLTLNVVAAARSGTLMASIEDAVNAIITPASLSVSIPGADVRLQVRVLLEGALQ